MKTNKIGSYAFIAMAIVGTLLIAGCPSPGDDGPVKFSGLIYGDTFSSALADPQHWEHTRGLVTTPEKTETYNNSAESYKVDWSEATGGTALAVNVGSGTTLEGTADLSTYNALTFWAKSATASAASIDEFGFGADDAALFPTNGVRFKTRIENVTIPTTWTKFIIPLPNPAKLTAVNNLFYAWDGAKGGTIYLDDIKFEKLTNVVLKANSLEIASATATVAVGGKLTITGVTAVFTDGTNDIALTYDPVAFTSWTSKATDKATVDNFGVITGVAAGEAEITGELGEQSTTLTVTVTEAVAFTGVIYDDELHGGFAVGSDSNGDIAIVSDSTESVAGGTGNSIKISQANGDWGGGFVQNDEGLDASGYNKIQFSIDVSNLGNTVDYMEIKFEDAEATAGVKSYNLYDLTASATNGDWKTYTFFTSTITGVDFAKFKHLGFWHPKAGGAGGTFTPGTFYVDDIKFIKDSTMPASFTVTYDANGGSGTLSKATDTVTEGSSATAAPTGITLTDKILSSWNTATDGSGTEFVFGTTLVTGDITLYAQWTDPPVTGPTTAPPAPSGSKTLYLHDATNSSVTTTWEDWGANAAAKTARSTETVDSASLTKLTNVGYQGISFTAADLSAATKVHIDIFSTSDIGVTFTIISTGKTGGTGESNTVITPTANQWTSVDINLANFNAVAGAANGAADLAKIDQAKFDGGIGANATGLISELWIGNVYFE